MALEAQEKRRINVTFPVALLEQLDEFLPSRERNRFIVEATARELHRERLRRALQESAGAWSDEDHPDLMTIEDVDRYVRRLRETWMPRSWDKIAAEAERNG